MLEFIKSPGDVFAVKLTGTVTAKDLETIVDRFEMILSKYPKIGVYVETKGIEGIEMSALPHHLNRSFPLFRELSKFERIAVVADQAWVRVFSRFESALLPYVSYRVYEPAERQEALDFAFKEKVPFEDKKVPFKEKVPA